MTSDGSNVVNLNRFRKQKARAEKDQRAAENREKFGRKKADKEKDADQQRRLDDHLDQHERAPEIED